MANRTKPRAEEEMWQGTGSRFLFNQQPSHFGSTVPLCVGLYVSPSLTPAGTFAGPQQKLLLVAVSAHHLRYSTREKTDGIPALQRLSDRRGILGEEMLGNEMAQTSRRTTASRLK